MRGRQFFFTSGPSVKQRREPVVTKRAFSPLPTPYAVVRARLLGGVCGCGATLIVIGAAQLLRFW